MVKEGQQDHRVSQKEKRQMLLSNFPLTSREIANVQLKALFPSKGKKPQDQLARLYFAAEHILERPEKVSDEKKVNFNGFRIISMIYYKKKKKKISPQYRSSFLNDFGICRL